MKAMKFIFFFTIWVFIQPANGQTYIIDAGHSTVTSSVQRFGAVNVIGRFKDVQGEIIYQQADINSTKAEVVIKVDSYDANNAGGEEAVKSEAFLNASAYPEINFSISSIEQTDKGGIATGNLTIHGTTNEVKFPFTVVGPVIDPPTRKQSIAIQGSLIINRQDYGVSFDRKFPDGTEVVSNMVKIDLNVLAIAKE